MKLQPSSHLIRRLAEPCEAVCSSQPTFSAEQEKSDHALYLQACSPCPCAQPANKPCFWKGTQAEAPYTPVWEHAASLPHVPSCTHKVLLERGPLGRESGQHTQTRMSPETPKGARPRVHALLPNPPVRLGRKRAQRVMLGRTTDEFALPPPPRAFRRQLQPLPRASGPKSPSQRSLSAPTPRGSCPAPEASHRAAARSNALRSCTARRHSPPARVSPVSPARARSAPPTPPTAFTLASLLDGSRPPRRDPPGRGRPAAGWETPHPAGPPCASPWRWRSQRRSRTAPTWRQQNRQRAGEGGGGHDRVRQRTGPLLKHARGGKGSGDSGSGCSEGGNGGAAFPARSREPRGGRRDHVVARGGRGRCLCYGR